jgi:ribonuclease P protein component
MWRPAVFSDSLAQLKCGRKRLLRKRPLPDTRPEMTREEDLSTVEAGAQAAPRLPGPHGDGRRSQGDRGPAGPRAQAPLGLTSRTASVPAERQGGIGRLTKRPEFLAAATGRRFHTGRMTLQGRRRDADGPAGLRVGFTLTRKVGHATERNRIRRRLRSAVAEAGLPFRAEPVDVVIIGRREAFAAPFPTLLDDLARGLAAVIHPSHSDPSGRRDRSRAPRPAAADGSRS